MNLLNMMGNMTPQGLINVMIKQNPNLQQAYNQMLQVQKLARGNINNVNFSEIMGKNTLSENQVKQLKEFAGKMGIPEKEVTNILRKIKTK